VFTLCSTVLHYYKQHNRMPTVNIKMKISVLVSTAKNKKLIMLRERNIGHSQKHTKTYTYALQSLWTKSILH